MRSISRSFVRSYVLDWIGYDWIGLDWIGLDWIGLDWIGYARTATLERPNE